MPKRSTISREQLLLDLADPQKAALYLNAAAQSSDQKFLVALHDVAAARHLPTVSRSIGLARQALYRMLSPTGNPTHENLRKIVKAVGLRLVVEPLGTAKAAKRAPVKPKTKAAKPVRGRK